MTDDIKTAAEAEEAAALPRAVAIRTEDGDPGIEDEPLPAAMSATPPERKSPARWAYERLALYIRKFEEGLDEDHEAAIAITGSGGDLMRIRGIGYFDPDIVTFYGMDPRGIRAQLIQHVSQLGVMLRAIPKARPDAPPKRIGFRLTGTLDGDAATDAAEEDGPA
ncbi:DUF6173 family protein [Tropicimonas sp. IMCC34011]|uniref:DUF6173 family protein n=1 Tax=Tropicimonas sp. IMCC34011 TaxID=2248759 RepID=UPI000E24DF11|nr:DUF6173 family protein [Tropicimonas sp. IMCC34011]